jgi:hypothetical protein
MFKVDDTDFFTISRNIQLHGKCTKIVKERERIGNIKTKDIELFIEQNPKMSLDRFIDVDGAMIELGCHTKDIHTLFFLCNYDIKTGLD